VNEDRPPENEGPRHQLRGEAEALEELGRERVQERQQAADRLDELRQRAEAAETRVAELEELGRERVQERQQAAARLDELRQRAEAAETRLAELEELGRERVQERQQAEGRLDELRQRAEAAETRVAELEAEIGEGILGRLRALCGAVRSTLQARWPDAAGR
jgi:chromosome segregation ATPase